MDQLLAAAAALPSAIFTTLVVVVVGYWLLVALGLADLDLIHIGDVHVDVDAGHGGHGHGFLELFSLGKVPVTVLATWFVLIAWLLCLAGEILLRPSHPVLGGPWPVGLGATVAALIGTGLAGRLLRPLFGLEDANRRERIIGRLAVVTSLTVDRTFGTATCLVEGDEILLNVVIRHSRPLAKGDHAVVVDWDDEAGVHVVAGYDDVPAIADQLPAPPALPVSSPPESPERT